MGGQKGSDGESKNDSLPLLAFAFCFFRLYALPFGMVLVAGFRMPQVERCKEWYAFCAFLLCLLIGTNDFFMVSSFVIAVCKEKAAELPFRSRWCLKPYPGTGVIAHGFSTGDDYHSYLSD